MRSFKDKTFCASPGCENECGRKMTEDEKKELIRDPMPVCYAYFCGILREIPGYWIYEESNPLDSDDA